MRIIVAKVLGKARNTFSFLLSSKAYRNDAMIENKRRLDDPIYLDRFGYKVYSQNDEDGMLDEIFRRIGSTNRCFVEFGVGDGLESNTHFLLFLGWSGLWIEGSKKQCKRIAKRFSDPIKSGRLKVLKRYVTAESINELISSEGKVAGEIDLLSIDIDGNDYWLWKAISCINPRVVVIEYNAKFPPPHEWVMPYNPQYIWDGSDLHGASLASMTNLGEALGYQLVATSSTGINAFFVRNDLCLSKFPQPATAGNLYHPWSTLKYFGSGHPDKRYIGV